MTWMRVPPVLVTGAAGRVGRAVVGELSPGHCGPLAMGRSDRDVSALGVLARDGFVVEPHPALG